MITTVSTTAPMPSTTCHAAWVSLAAMTTVLTHLPTATFRSARAMCRIRTAESLTLSTPSDRLVD